MSIRFAVVVALVIAVLGVFPTAPLAADLAIVGATVYPAPDAAPIPDATVVVHDGRIAAVGSSASTRVPRDATMIDGKGLHVVAGFWNSHVHLLGPEFMKVPERSSPALDNALIAMLTRWGFTAAFDIASVPGNTLALRQRIERGDVRGPLLLTVDAPFYPTNGTPIYVRKLYADNGWPSAEVATTAAARDRARRQLASGADGVKLFTGAIVGGKAEVMPLDAGIAKAVVDEAKAKRKVAFAHPTDIRGLTIAIDAGVTILAHPTPTDGPWTPEIVARVKANDVALTPTLALFAIELVKLGVPEPVRERLQRDAAQQVKALNDAGGTILFGTDVGYLPDPSTVHEFDLMADAGMSWRAILASLTTSPAQRFGYGERKGRIHTGMDADLVILGSDPAKERRAFADVRYTIRAGNVLFRAD